jgi:hypothetical protein
MRSFSAAWGRYLHLLSMFVCFIDMLRDLSALDRRGRQTVLVHCLRGNIHNGCDGSLLIHDCCQCFLSGNDRCGSYSVRWCRAGLREKDQEAACQVIALAGTCFFFFCSLGYYKSSKEFISYLWTDIPEKSRA